MSHKRQERNQEFRNLLFWAVAIIDYVTCFFVNHLFYDIFHLNNVQIYWIFFFGVRQDRLYQPFTVLLKTKQKTHNVTQQ